MGKFDFEVSPELVKMLSRLGNVDKYAPEMIDGAMPILEANLKKELAKHVRTHDMLNSVKKTRAGKMKNGGYFATVRPTGVDQKGVRNMEKLAHAEYGTSKQAPTPILTKAINDSKGPVTAKMYEIFEEVTK